MCVDAVQDAAEEAARRARAAAPALKKWQTMEDSLVRHTHRKVNQQKVPANLRFELESMEWDMQHRGLGPKTYMLFPRDETSRAVVNIINCRCRLVIDENGVGQYVKVTQAKAEGSK